MLSICPMALPSLCTIHKKEENYSKSLISCHYLDSLTKTICQSKIYRLELNSLLTNSKYLECQLKTSQHSHSRMRLKNPRWQRMSVTWWRLEEINHIILMHWIRPQNILCSPKDMTTNLIISSQFLTKLKRRIKSRKSMRKTIHPQSICKDCPINSRKKY